MRNAFRHRACPGLVVLVTSALLGTISDTRAADWQFVPSIGVSENYTDNVFLTEDDTQGDFITSLTPGVSVRGEGRRLSINADYNYQHRKFLDNSSLDNGTHNLRGDVQSELVRNHLFFDGFASMFPSIVSNDGLISNRNRQLRANQLDANNRTNVISWGFSPRWIQNFGSLATFEASTSYDDTSTGDRGSAGAGAGSGSNQEWRMGVRSGRRFARTTWGLNYSNRKNDNQNQSQNSTFQTLNANTGYQINRLFRVTSTFGFEDNDFQSNAGQQQSGFVWSLGGVLTPSPRTRIGGSFGQRVFGNTKNFDFSHTRRRFTVSGRYTEELRTSSEILREQQVFNRIDAFGNPINIDPTNNLDFRQPLDGLSLTDDVFVSRRFSSSIGYFRKRDNFSMNVFRNEQESTRTEISERTFGVNGNWRRSLSRQVAAGVNVDYNIRESDGSNGETTFMSFTPFVSYAIGPQLSSQFSYSYLNSDSEAGNDSFTENSVLGSLSYAF